MSRTMIINQIEQQIEALQPVEQVMMLERIVRHLKQLLLAQPIAVAPRTECKGIVEKLNQVYKTETSGMDRQLLKAQCATFNRDEWR